MLCEPLPIARRAAGLRAPDSAALGIASSTLAARGAALARAHPRVLPLRNSSPRRRRHVEHLPAQRREEALRLEAYSEEGDWGDGFQARSRSLGPGRQLYDDDGRDYGEASGRRREQFRSTQEAARLGRMDMYGDGAGAGRRDSQEASRREQAYWRERSFRGESNFRAGADERSAVRAQGTGAARAMGAYSGGIPIIRQSTPAERSVPKSAVSTRNASLAELPSH